MKKLVFILSLLLLTNCSKEEQECSCEKAKFAYFNETSSGYFYMRNVKLDCETGKPIKNNNTIGKIYIGCED